MTNVYWTKYKTWSGCRIAGTEPFILNEEHKTNHMWRALWLTSQVEVGGKFGAINSYDGAGISAGLEQRIGVFPKSMKQGTIWEFLREMEVHSPCKSLQNLWDALKQEKMFVAQDGVLRHLETGKAISAQQIRDLVAPPGSKVPQSGPNWEQAKKWALLFHELYADPATFNLQVSNAISSLVASNQKDESAAYQSTIGVDHPSVLILGKNIDPEHDLAWCVYHSFSVNAPGMARVRLRDSKPDNKKSWPQRLIKTLGTTNYGAWHDTVDGANRYDRTRMYAMNSGLWDKELFDGPTAIMPKNL